MKGKGKIVKRIFKYTGIGLGSILLLMFLLPVLFPGYVSDQIKEWANNSIKGELNFSKARLSFFNHFPSLTLTLYDVSLKGSAPFQKDTLVAAKEIALGVDIPSVFGKTINIDEIYLTKGKLNILADKDGRPNYNVYVSTDTIKNVNDSSTASLKLERIQIDDCALNYDDRSIPFLLTVDKLNYLGKGDLSKAIFELSSNIKMEGASIGYGGQNYLDNKKLDAQLVTKINTNSLSFFFDKNDLKINKLPVEFIGKFDFLKNGYDMDFSLKTNKTDFANLFTALPPPIVKWVEKRSVKGDLTMDASLKGQYIAEQKIAPTLAFNMKVENGFMNAKKADEPARNFLIDFHVKLPQLNTDSLLVDLDTVNLSIATRYLRGSLHTKGLMTPYIKGSLAGEVDISKFNKIFGNPDTLELKGMYMFNASIDGLFSRGQNPKKLRPDTIITSIPTFNFVSSFKDGYLKYFSLPQALQNISFNLDAYNKDNVYEHTHAKLDNINAVALNNFIKGFIHVDALNTFPVSVDLKTKFNLADIKSFYPIKDIDLKGNLDVDIVAKGNYDAAKRKFPVTNAYINLNNGEVKTPYYPQPIKDIKLELIVSSTKGTMKDLEVNLKPVSLTFEGQPFMLTSDLKNFDNLQYNITSKGTLDIGKIYKAFAVKGYNVKGIITTNFALNGTQADAMAGRYNKLNNKGTVKLQEVNLLSDMFPKPFIVQSGSLHFNNDQLVADNLQMNYGSTHASVKGYFNNIINYLLQENAPLQGQLTLATKYLNVDELMAFSSDTTVATTASGVVIVPTNLDVQFFANADKVSYNGINLTKAISTVAVKDGKLTLNNTGFTIVDAPVTMDVTYQPLSPIKALFDYHITAKEFDIKKAYNEIELFRTMATSASSMQGLVGLDYKLSGVLDKDMHPVMPSLKGGGILTLQKVKVKGFKLFNAMGKATGRDSLATRNPDLSKVDIKTTIAHNIITIQRTKLRMFGFRPRFEGQVSFSGKLNLKARLGLPPLGIFGIPFSVTGTQEKPIIKLKKGSDKDELKPEEYDEDYVSPDPANTEKKG